MLIKRRQEPLSTPMGGGHTALLCEETGEYLTFDETATAIWEKTRNPIEFDALVTELAGEYGVDIVRLRKDVRGALDTLSDKKLIEMV